MEHIGIDVHKNQSQICILTPEGELIEKSICTERDGLQRFWAIVHRVGLSSRCALGSSGGGAASVVAELTAFRRRYCQVESVTGRLAR